MSKSLVSLFNLELAVYKQRNGKSKPIGRSINDCITWSDWIDFSRSLDPRCDVKRRSPDEVENYQAESTKTFVKHTSRQAARAGTIAAKPEPAILARPVQWPQPIRRRYASRYANRAVAFHPALA